jgi:hypothetical protein
MSKSAAEDIADQIVAQGYSSSSNTFVNDVPDTDSEGIPDNIVAVMDIGGFPPDDSMGNNAENPTFENPGVQVTVRHNNAETGQNTCYDIFKYLHGFYGTIGSVEYLLIQGNTSPFVLKRDENERWHYVCTFDVERRPAS